MKKKSKFHHPANLFNGKFPVFLCGEDPVVADLPLWVEDTK